MAYKYFSEKLLAANVDLSAIFPDKQQVAKDQNNVTYGLGDVVIYLQDVTNNFKSQDSSYIDLDNAVQEIMTRYYKSEGVENPFLVKKVSADSYQEGVVPSESLTVKDGKTESKGVVSPKKVGVAVAEEPVVTKEQELTEKIQKFKKSLENAELFIDLADSDEEKQDEINRLRRKLVGIELLDEEDDYMTFMKTALKDFLTKYE
jgi:hypothetical protein